MATIPNHKIWRLSARYNKMWVQMWKAGKSQHRSPQTLGRMWKWKSLSRRTFCDPMDYRVHGILQARILEWVSFSFSRGSSQPRDRTQVSCIAGGFFNSLDSDLWIRHRGEDGAKKERTQQNDVSLATALCCITSRLVEVKVEHRCTVPTFRDSVS